MFHEWTFTYWQPSQFERVEGFPLMGQIAGPEWNVKQYVVGVRTLRCTLTLIRNQRVTTIFSRTWPDRPCKTYQKPSGDWKFKSKSLHTAYEALSCARTLIARKQLWTGQWLHLFIYLWSFGFISKHSYTSITSRSWVDKPPGVNCNIWNL